MNETNNFWKNQFSQVEEINCEKRIIFKELQLTTKLKNTKKGGKKYVENFRWKI